MTSPIQLFAFGTGWGVPFQTSAPFPLKLATWLRMARVPFEIVEANDAGKGPKGKSPWIEWEGTRMGDSSLIIEHVASKLDIDLDAHLDARQRALGTTIQRMLEEHYHQCFEHQLFFGEGAQDRVKEFQTMVPFPINLLLPTVIRRSFAKQLHARGMGRHKEAVIVDQGKADLDALAELLGDQSYMLGDSPSALDACVFGFLGVSVYVKGDNPLFRHAASHDNLMRYCERMRGRYFPETLESLPLMFKSANRAAEGAA
ncbi:MAG: glutathione S-transferase family protein [Myxococcales bacterium]|nr:glutathione S-transferase family protein [Myxococcales bacterium]